jgi:phosphoribosylformimino-5-aminoimidazole carboxamide ribotide isomerase
MHIIPAIDILNGEVVRLHQGDYTTATVYKSDPTSVARDFQKAGATRLHIVDLDAASGGGKQNRKKLRKIRKLFGGIIELGGGIRNEDDIEELLDIGIDRFVVGTAFAKNPHIVEGWVQHYGKLFIAGIDARDGKVKVSGWQKETELDYLELAERAKSIGMCSIIFTNIAHDGTMQGPDIESTKRVAASSSLPVIHSGGVSTMEDLKLLADSGETKIKGTIVGKAIYERTVDLEEAIKTFQADDEDGEEW